jgi:alpha-D-xyloside xylohydrolase
MAAGCGGEEAAPRPGRKEQITAGDISVRVDTGPSEIALLRGETVLLRFPAGSIELGAVPALSDATNYDPYRFYAPSPLYTPPDVTWRKLASIDVSDVSPASISLALTFEGGLRGALRIEAGQGEGGAGMGMGMAPKPPGSRFKAVLTPEPGGADIAFFRLRPRIDPDEAFYGLGEYFDDVNHRGKIRAMQLEFTPDLESSYNEAHVPVPFVIGTLGWGLFVESPYPGVFAVAAPEDPTSLHAAFGTGLASSEGLTFHLFGAGHPLDVTRLYYDVTGYPRLPARWALGPWVWRDESKDQAEVESDLNTMRDRDLPTTGYWIDRPYATGVNTFDFNKAQFPDAQAMIDLAHGLGFRMALWHTPYLDEADLSTAALRQHATENGFYPTEKGLLLNKWGTPVDLTNPGAYAWWQELIRSYTDMGIEGFKMDYGEDIVPGLTADRNRWVFSDKSDERTMHARFQLFYHKVYSETLPEDGGFLLCRGGTYGDQQSVSVIWPGDLDASFARHGEEITQGGDTFNAVGGLPASIIAGLSLGPSGFPFYGADTGGYRHSPPNKELFTRWFEQTALSTVMQIGTSSNTVAWEPSGGPGFDEEMLNWYRIYTRLHLRLFPYEWTYAKRLQTDGRPIQRALGLAYPELGAHPSDTYLFGDHLLVAPVVEEGKTSREVLLPPGGWVDWWTGEVHQGGAAITVDAPLEKLPLFMAAGSVVPLLRPTIDSMAPTTDPMRVDSYATTPGLIYARVVAGSKSVFTLFDGAEAAQELLPGSIALSWKGGSEFTSGAIFEVIALGGGGKKPSGVAIGGVPAVELPSLAALEAAPSGWTFDTAMGGTVYVKVGAGEQTALVTLP